MHIANNFTFHSLVKKKGNFVCAYFNHVKFLDAKDLFYDANCKPL